MKNLLLLFSALAVTATVAAQPVKRIGIIGLDTSHSTAFTELLNGDSDDPLVSEFEVVAAYPYGSTVIPSSYERIPGYIREVEQYGVHIVDSIDELIAVSDCILLPCCSPSLRPLPPSE